MVRPQDMLVVDITLINLRFDGRHLVRRKPGDPTLVLVGLPPQHVLEEVAPNLGPATPASPSMQAFASGASQLAFSVPDDVESLDLSLASLLDWERLVPLTVPVNQQSPDEPGTTVFGGIPRSVLEFPTRLLLTYDEPVDWTCPTEPHDVQGRTTLWHALLRGAQDGNVLLRAFARARGRAPVAVQVPLTEENREDLVTLTSRAELVDRTGAPIDVPSAPLHAEQFIATPLRASAHLHGGWADLSTTAGAQLAGIGRHPTDLVGYDHITGLGRDQFVRVVTRGFLSPGQPALLVSEFKRLFVARPDDGIVAYLQKEERIVLRDPEVRYGAGTGFRHEGRELPFSSLRVTDRVTPPIKPVERDADEQPKADVKPFWVELEGSDRDVEFTLNGTDHEGRTVTFTAPLVFVPASRADDGPTLLALYAEEGKRRNRLDRSMDGQVMAMAQPPADAPGSTSHPVGKLTFGMTERTAGGQHPLAGLLTVSAAEVRVPAVEQFTPDTGNVPVVFNETYLNQTMAGHPAGAYLELCNAVDLSFGAEAAGGIARPNSSVKLITARAGVVPNVFQAETGTGKILDAAPVDDIRKAFGSAKLLGFIDLGKLVTGIVKDDLERLRQLGDSEIQNILDSAGAMLPAPVLRIRDLVDGAGKELRYVWKTRLANPSGVPAVLDVSDSVLILDARTVASTEAEKKSSVEGRLTDVALEFAGVARVEIAELRFKAAPGTKPDVSASGLELAFLGGLQFINTLRSALPANGFGSGAYVDIQPSGIRTGYTLALPAITLGVFTLANVSLSAELVIPFEDDGRVAFRFSVSERQHPFNVTVSLFGGGGYFSMLVDSDGIRQAEGAIEFGGSAALNLGVASGGVSIMAGIRFELNGDDVTVGGYLRCNGFLNVLGIITVSVEFYLELTYEKHGHESVVRGRGTLTVSVKIAFFSKSVSLSLERSFSGSPGDPTFVDCFDKDTHWEDYCLAFAP
ncbi:hypothetical protein [Streptomyces sp. B1I3]|uniref:hypothetical protein n=1 Tax=Streptomyces sp. B1I3 TaxID=3042264 RepID=UPI0027862AE5|nr:hypothetical protein [Streptomyces sp. B1I3]MDQ0792989.1 hypothetical protein [Streptomyces sp. B1I3]